ncbi:MAG: hypothetical protein QM783_19470 [Phycisphaerales bacterium]
MKSVILAVSAVAALSSAAMADYSVSMPGPYNFSASAGGNTVTTSPLTGTVTGIIVSFTYSNSADESWAADMAFTLGSLQWGGYDVLINGASAFQGGTGAPNSGAATTFTSGTLALGSPLNLSEQALVVGCGNGYSGGTCTLSDVTITLVGSVPTPGAAAVLGLGGLALGRRRRA